MKAVTIKFDHGRIWTAETSDGKRATGSTLAGVLNDLLPFASETPRDPGAYKPLEDIFAGVRDANVGQIQHGQAGA